MKKLYGVTVAMVIPMFQDSQEVDHPTLEKLVKILVKKGVHSIYFGGTDSEVFHLSVAERKKIAETIVKAANGEVVVYAHCGAMLRNDTLELIEHAAGVGADGVGVITPIYFPLTDRELEAYYIDVAKSVSSDIPIYIYNIPQLAINDIKPHVVQQLVRKAPNIVGIKYNYPNVNQTLDYLKINDGAFSVLQGDDRVMTAWLALGCDGTVAGSANVFPEPLVASFNAFKDGDYDKALEQANIAAEFIDAMHDDTVAYFKAGLGVRGLDVGSMRKPYLDLEDKEREKLSGDLKKIAERHGIPLNITD